MNFLTVSGAGRDARFPRIGLRDDPNQHDVPLDAFPDGA